MSRSDARFRTPTKGDTQDCARCGNEYVIEALHYAPVGDVACWSCLRAEERNQIIKELND